MKIVVFAEYTHCDKFENDINEWLSKNQVVVKDIKYSSYVDEYAIYHSALILYENKEEQ